jgi:hypothetical protein
MSCTTTRFKVKRGAIDTLLATFDVSNIPSGSLTSVTIEWFVKRNTQQNYYDIYKTSADPAQIRVLDPVAGTVNVYLQRADTQSLQTGCYYWAFALSNPTWSMYQITPSTYHGDLIILDSAVM